jgi:hypothetical protein
MLFEAASKGVLPIFEFTFFYRPNVSFLARRHGHLPFEKPCNKMMCIQSKSP